MRMAESAGPSLPAGRIAFTYPDFTIYQAARFFIVAALEMQSVAVGWQVYEITRRPLDLGLIGLAQFLPGMLWFRDMWQTASTGAKWSRCATAASPFLPGCCGRSPGAAAILFI